MPVLFTDPGSTKVEAHERIVQAAARDSAATRSTRQVEQGRAARPVIDAVPR